MEKEEGQGRNKNHTLDLFSKLFLLEGSLDTLIAFVLNTPLALAFVYLCRPDAEVACSSERALPKRYPSFLGIRSSFLGSPRQLLWR
jgi:hypothetical protein